ncbi:hypothetical protein [Abyssalbus ytuae]|uniref:Uncharacterized protein n=1 Tax=Abyssalbus ytuae TaxID=2926907 RepID=A0A9E6ZS42_9FLAO|nr:hypothetical protein [Abyssalbus ytuae]UOB17823.1 hypothetical protein MQE35_00655 [Abyssalbus ytuae]
MRNRKNAWEAGKNARGTGKKLEVRKNLNAEFIINLRLPTFQGGTTTPWHGEG